MGQRRLFALVRKPRNLKQPSRQLQQGGQCIQGSGQEILKEFIKFLREKDDFFALVE